METKPILENEPVETSPAPIERHNRFMELMETRHRNAMAVLGVERILFREEPLSEYPTTLTTENKLAKKEALLKLEPILESLSKTGLIRQKERVREAIDRYIVKKISTQRAELDLKERLRFRGIEPTSHAIGSELFRQKTGKDPEKPVRAVRQEGYFVMTFSDHNDYNYFVAEPDKEQSGGLFCQAMRFPNMSVDVILDRDGTYPATLVHERQHFINGSILNDFSGIENRQVPLTAEFPLLAKIVKDLKKGVIYQNLKRRNVFCGVKNELLARVRDGSGCISATDFFEKDLYRYLHDQFSEDEQVEVNTLLSRISQELTVAFDYSRQPVARAVLVYHLVDIPLLRFPERIQAVVNFFEAEMRKFTALIPDGRAEQQVLDAKKQRQLLNLRGEISEKAFRVEFLITGGENANYDELEKRKRLVRSDIDQLRKRYFSLLAESLA